ncbi:hypothetical protein [Mucilaginibacter pedocola]|uniref:Uncharacterized protein n=1 Tax=Mucilaginibacter pedocola TaxID=1792845 RepID=A0A1S9PIZ9_9SPHI|nr:hypothetical protein [Mucilaginibacter pedocola]OOQ60909.1 hypothetical protein BC343_23395 [Mucilaginibacter pedocola]
MPNKIQNNFKSLMNDFSTDTGMSAIDNMGLYIQYFNARMSDKIMQYNAILIHELINKLDRLPDEIGSSVFNAMKGVR